MSARRNHGLVLWAGRAWTVVLLAMLAAASAIAMDDGSQMNERFRINYLGYYRNGHKIALFIASEGRAKSWELKDSAGATVASGTSKDYVANDFASGDSFFRVDFSDYSGTGNGFTLVIDGSSSQAFDIDASNPYGTLANESFDYFRDHRTPTTTFDQFREGWGSGSVSAPFWNDAGDKGSYPTNTAMAAWVLMNLYERFPAANDSYTTGTTLYDELRFGTEIMQRVILPGQRLAIPKLHTHVADWAPCSPHTSGTCLSKPETKATYAVARSLAQMARLHRHQGQSDEARSLLAQARTALSNAQTAPPVCRGFDDFGGEGGIYPDNDTYSLWRNPKSFREPCHPDRDNTEDDEFAALVEVYLAAAALGDPDSAALKRRVTSHARFGEVSAFWWGAVATTGNLSLLTLRPPDVDLTRIRAGLYRYADGCVKNMATGYPGVTFDARSHRWDSGDKDSVDNNWRWGSNRMLLDDAMLLATAAEEKLKAGESRAAAGYCRYALRVMDYILGTNGMALSMVTGFGENAVLRTHDCCVSNGEPGKMVLGPNDWTNADDGDMPPFGSQPGMKMMPKTGTGWAAREVAIDGNAPLAWMAWWAGHRAGACLDLDPIKTAGRDNEGRRR